MVIDGFEAVGVSVGNLLVRGGNCKFFDPDNLKGKI